MAPSYARECERRTRQSAPDAHPWGKGSVDEFTLPYITEELNNHAVRLRDLQAHYQLKGGTVNSPLKPTFFGLAGLS